MTKKKTEDPTARYRVTRSFVHDGVLISHASRLASLPPAVLKERVERGYIEDRAPAASDTAPAEKAKE